MNFSKSNDKHHRDTLAPRRLLSPKSPRNQFSVDEILVSLPKAIPTSNRLAQILSFCSCLMVIGCFISCYADLLAVQQKYWALGKPARNKGFVNTAGILDTDSAVRARNKEMLLRDVKILG
jgi:hypothetical protein